MRGLVAWEPDGLRPAGPIAGGHGNPSRVPISGGALPWLRAAVLVGVTLWPLLAAGGRDTGTLWGRVVYRGRGIPHGRTVRIEIGTRFPLLGGGERSQKVDSRGGFSFPDLPAGSYWVVAYIDDDADGRRGPGEICGFPRAAPVIVGPGHGRVRIKIDLDPVHAIVATRFRRHQGSARNHLAFAALYARDPATGKPLLDAEASLEEDGQSRPLTYDPGFPGGAYVAYGAGQPAAERFVFTISHPALGRVRRRIVLHGRSLGSEPTFPIDAPARAVAGQDLKVPFRQPPWANFATLEVFESDRLTGLRRLWPAAVGESPSAESPALVPGRLLWSGRRRLEVVAGRADVRAENGEIWAFAVAGREIQVGPAPIPPAVLPPSARPRPTEGPRPDAGVRGATAPAPPPPREAGPRP